MTTLYTLTGQMIGLHNLMEDGLMDADTLQDTLDGLTGELEQKAESLLGYVANVGSDVSAIDVEIKRLQARKQVMINRQDSLREYLRMNMEVSGTNKITCPLFSITLRKPTQMVDVVERSLLPDEYLLPAKPIPELQPDKRKILATLKAEVDVPGCRLMDGKRGLLIK
jgi:hypothetical protein